MITNPEWVNGTSMCTKDYGPVLLIVSKIKFGWSWHMKVQKSGSITRGSDPRTLEAAKECAEQEAKEWYERNG